MIGEYQGHFKYSKTDITKCDSSDGGVYYLGNINANGKLGVLYVGKAFGKDGIRGRLLQHLNDNEWPDISHFGFKTCSTEKESLEFESIEIERLKPKHNKIGK